MKAVNSYIVIEKIKEEAKKEGGLFLTESQNKDIRYLKGKVISIGNLVEGVTNGDIIYYDRHAGHGVEHANSLYHVIRQQDVVIVV